MGRFKLKITDMKKTIKELIELREAAKNFKIADFELNYQLFELMVGIDKKLKAFDETKALAEKKANEFNQKVVALNEKYCIRENGNPVIRENRYSFADKDIPKRQKEYDTLISEYGKWLNAVNGIDIKFNELLEKEVEISMPVVTDFSKWSIQNVLELSDLLPVEIKIADLPDGVTAKHLYELSKKGKKIVRE